MLHILKHVARFEAEFRPKTLSEFFALQLARELNDVAELRTYLSLVERHSQELLGRACKNTTQQTGRTAGLAQRFQHELIRLTSDESLTK